jgi:hypothetical protein
LFVGNEWDKLTAFMGAPYYGCRLATRGKLLHPSLPCVSFFMFNRAELFPEKGQKKIASTPSWRPTCHTILEPT